MDLHTFNIEAPITNKKKPFYYKERESLVFRNEIRYNFYIECSKINEITGDKEFYLLLSNTNFNDNCRKLKRDSYGRYFARLHNEVKDYVIRETKERGNIDINYIESKDYFDIYNIV